MTLRASCASSPSSSRRRSEDMKRGSKGQCVFSACLTGGRGGGGEEPFPFQTIMSSVLFKDKSFKSSSPFLLRQIEYYQRFIDPKLKKKLHVKRICRYSPTCSEYGRLSIKRHGTVKGIAFTIYRLLRCNPFSSGGHDPVKP